jgi:hypothetical protein
MMHANIRDYRVADAQALNSVALAAFMQFKDEYPWTSRPLSRRKSTIR